MATVRHSWWGALALCGAVTASAQAGDILYASTGDANAAGGGRIFKIDPVAQTTTFVVDTGLDKLGGIDFDSGGTLYGISGGSVGPATLYTINLFGGTSFIGTVPNIQGCDALRFDSTGNLFAGGWNGSGQLTQIDPSNANNLGNLALIGSGNSFTPGLAFDGSGTLFASRGNAGGHTEDLAWIDMGTGAMTAIGGATDTISDIWFGSGGTLYGISTGGSLYTINPGTGDKTFVFDTGVQKLSGLTGVVPTPGAGALLALAGLAAGRRRR